MACRECVDYDSPDFDERWDEVGCLDGIVYGYCDAGDVCGGLCGDLGNCVCECHEGPA